MITLFGCGAVFGLPDASPYVTKTEVQLRMAGIAYEKRVADPQEGPKGKVPFIDEDGLVIGDSTFIREHIERTRGIDFDAGLTARQRAEAWAVERMLEDNFSWASGHFRWIVPENFARGPAHFMDALPEGIRDQAREEMLGQVKATFHAVGMGRHAEPEILRLGARSLAALAEILGDKPYLFGDAPCGTDATAFAMLIGVMTPFFPSALRDAALSHANLCAYADRMMARYHPEHPWTAVSRLPQAA